MRNEPGNFVLDTRYPKLLPTPPELSNSLARPKHYEIRNDTTDAVWFAVYPTCGTRQVESDIATGAGTIFALSGLAALVLPTPFRVVLTLLAHSTRMWSVLDKGPVDPSRYELRPKAFQERSLRPTRMKVLWWILFDLNSSKIGLPSRREAMS